MSRADSPLRGRMIFIVGARRSGTFWLQRIVTAHPQVSGVASETHLFSHGIAPLFDRFQHSVRSSTTVGKAYVDRGTILDAARDLCDVVFSESLDPGASHLAERTPLHVLHLDLIAAIYPDAHFVHIVRDGRDVARSIVAQSWGPDTIEGAAEEWRSAILAAEGASIPPERYREIRYEDLLQRPRETASHLYGWLDLPVSPQIVEDAVTEGRIGANLGDQPSAIGTEKWRQALTSAELAAFDRVAGDVLSELSYPPSAGRTRGPHRPASPGSVDRVRAGITALRRVLGARRPRSRPTVYWQHLMDDVVESLRARDYDRLAALTSEDVRVRVISANRGRDARGNRGRELLRDVLENEFALKGRQLRGDVFPGTPYAGLVLTHETEGGRLAKHVTFMRFTGDRVGELILYRL